MEIRGGANGKFTGDGLKHTIKEAEKIVNEYGDLVFNLLDNKSKDEGFEIDLFDYYTAVTAVDIVNEKESEEIRKEMLQCIERQQENEDTSDQANFCRSKPEER